MKLRLYGDKASAEWIQANPEELKLCHKNGRVEIVDRGAAVKLASQARYNRMKPGHPSGFVEAFANLYADIAQQIKTAKESEYVYGFEHARAGLNLFSACSESDEHKQWQEIVTRISTLRDGRSKAV